MKLSSNGRGGDNAENGFNHNPAALVWKIGKLRSTELERIGGELNRTWRTSPGVGGKQYIHSTWVLWPMLCFN
jgi:hypothetical protein